MFNIADLYKHPGIAGSGAPVTRLSVPRMSDGGLGTPRHAVGTELVPISPETVADLKRRYRNNPAVMRQIDAYERELADVGRYNEAVDEWGRGINELGERSDALFNQGIAALGQPEQYSSEAIGLSDENIATQKGYFDELRGLYKDIIPETIAQAREGVLREQADYEGEMSRAGATAAQAHDQNRAARQREYAQYGLNLGQSLGREREAGLARAGDITTARNTAFRSERERSDAAKLGNFQIRQGIASEGARRLDSGNQALTSAYNTGIGARTSAAGSAGNRGNALIRAAELLRDSTREASTGLGAFAAYNQPGYTDPYRRRTASGIFAY